VNRLRDKELVFHNQEELVQLPVYLTSQSISQGRWQSNLTWSKLIL